MNDQQYLEHRQKLHAFAGGQYALHDDHHGAFIYPLSSYFGAWRLAINRYRQDGRDAARETLWEIFRGLNDDERKLMMDPMVIYNNAPSFDLPMGLMMGVILTHGSEPEFAKVKQEATASVVRYLSFKDTKRDYDPRSFELAQWLEKARPDKQALATHLKENDDYWSNTSFLQRCNISIRKYLYRYGKGEPYITEMAQHAWPRSPEVAKLHTNYMARYAPELLPRYFEKMKQAMLTEPLEDCAHEDKRFWGHKAQHRLGQYRDVLTALPKNTPGLREAAATMVKHYGENRKALLGNKALDDNLCDWSKRMGVRADYRLYVDKPLAQERKEKEAALEKRRKARAKPLMAGRNTLIAYEGGRQAWFPKGDWINLDKVLLRINEREFSWLLDKAYDHAGGGAIREVTMFGGTWHLLRGEINGVAHLYIKVTEVETIKTVAETDSVRAACEHSRLTRQRESGKAML